jgi:hypothetical protein
MKTNKYSTYHFFEKKEFSSRYGDEIFSVSFDSEPIREKSQEPSRGMLDGIASALGVTTGGGCCVPNNIIYYRITVYQGKWQWVVKRRYSEFLALQHKLTHGVHGGSSLHEIVNRLDFPPTTIFDVSNDISYCKDRQEDLAGFFITMLQVVSSKHMITEDILKFLGIDDDDPNSISSSVKTATKK